MYGSEKVKPPEDGKSNQMTLPSEHKIKNSSPGGPRASTPPLDHGGSHITDYSRVNREEIFCAFEISMK